MELVPEKMVSQHNEDGILKMAALGFFFQCNKDAFRERPVVPSLYQKVYQGLLPVCGLDT